MKILETERLILRPINKDDASDIFEYGWSRMLVRLQAGNLIRI